MSRSLRVAALPVLIGGWGVSAAAASARTGTQVVRYHGHRVVVTATWRAHVGVIERALRTDRLTATRSVGRSRESRTARAAPSNGRAARSSPLARAAAATYTGLGFDPCATPSMSAMSAWGASPYRAIGVYVGGANLACSQPNLTTTW